MIKIVSLHFGTGGGHLFGGLALWESFKLLSPQKFTFYLFTNVSIDVPLDNESLEIVRLDLEPDIFLQYPVQTSVFQYLKHIEPDILIVDHIWLPVLKILPYFKKTKKIIYFRFVPDLWFNTPELEDGQKYNFDPSLYNLSYSIDPGFDITNSISISPMINIRNDLMKPRYEIRRYLEVPDDKKLALIAHNGVEGELENILKDADIDSSEYCLRSISSFDHDISTKLFPLAHYMSGVDLAIGGCGYNFFYETKALGIKTLYFPQPRIGNEQHWRLEHCLDYDGPYDGADQMVQQILDLF